MTRIVSVLKGLHKSHKRLADGSVRVYCYAWRGGPRLNDADGQPLAPNDPRLVEAYNAAKEGALKPRASTVLALVGQYRTSTDMPKSEAARREYMRYLRMIEDQFGKMPLRVAQDPRARGDFKRWRDTMAATPRKADYAWMVLARVMSFGVDRGLLKVNVCARGGKLYRAHRAEKIWTEEHIDRFLAVASPELAHALVLALWTGQRQGDLLKLSWFSYDGNAIRLKQGKTAARITIPAGETLKAFLGVSGARSGVILRNGQGEAWTSSGFRSSWNKARRRAGIDDVTFHDLRGSAVVRLAIAGCTIPQIASITGHSPKDADAILHAHYLGRDIRLAEEAMRRLEEKEAGTISTNRTTNRVLRSPSDQPEVPAKVLKLLASDGGGD